MRVRILSDQTIIEEMKSLDSNKTSFKEKTTVRNLTTTMERQARNSKRRNKNIKTNSAKTTVGNLLLVRVKSNHNKINCLKRESC